MEFYLERERRRLRSSSPSPALSSFFFCLNNLGRLVVGRTRHLEIYIVLYSVGRASGREPIALVQICIATGPSCHQHSICMYVEGSVLGRGGKGQSLHLIGQHHPGDPRTTFLHWPLIVNRRRSIRVPSYFGAFTCRRRFGCRKPQPHLLHAACRRYRLLYSAISPVYHHSQWVHRICTK